MANVHILMDSERQRRIIRHKAHFARRMGESPGLMRRTSCESGLGSQHSHCRISIHAPASLDACSMQASAVAAAHVVAYHTRFVDVLYEHEKKCVRRIWSGAHINSPAMFPRL